MNYWNKIPLFRIILPFLIGIIIAFHFQLSTIYLCIIILATVIGVLYISYFKRYFSSFSKRWIFGILINLLFVVFGVLITQQHKPINKRSTMKFDYIIVSKKARLNLSHIKCKQVIIDSSVPKYNLEQIKKECLKWDIPFYNVSTQGAYLFKITSF